MFFGYGIVNNHAPILKATVMKIAATISSLPTSLYAVYKGESNANDSLGVYNGTAQGGLTYSGGKSGNAFVGNGTNAYVNLGSNIFNSFTSDFSVSAWINVNSVVGTKIILSNLGYNTLTGVAIGWFVYCNDDKIQLLIARGSGGSNVSLFTSPVLSTSTWFHIAIVRKSLTSSKIYVNGSLSVSDTSTINPNYTLSSGGSPSGIPSIIGAWKMSDGAVFDYMNGKIDELYTWNRELTATEITELYNTGAGKFYPTF